MEWIILIILGLAAGTLGSLMGLGGGIVVVPGLMILSGVFDIISGITPQVAVGTSLLIMIFTGLSSTLTYIKQKKVDFVSGTIFLTGSIPGALYGVYLNKDIDVSSFLVYFGTFIIIISLILMIRKYLKPVQLREKGIKRSYIRDNGEVAYYGYSLYLAIPISFVVGMLSGLFGIGGGSLMVPAMILLFGFPTHMAIATSMFMIFFSAIVSSLSHIALGNVNWLFALALIPGAWFGGRFGAMLNQRLKSDTLVIILRISLIVIAIRLIWQGITG